MTKSGFAAIIGKPNAGKSTLMNSLLGARLSIVTPKPQTTRKKVLGIYSSDYSQIIFLDTPGILKPKNELQKVMMSYVEESIGDVDVVCVLLDIEAYGKAEEYFDEDFLNIIKNIKKPIILALNKIDLIKDVRETLPIIDKYSKTGLFEEIVPVSALKNANTAEFIAAVEKHLPSGAFFYDPEMLSTYPERFFVSEIIREHVFKYYEQEIPYSSEVSIVEFKERGKGKWYINAEIIVERASQKGIIIGAKGLKIKKIGEKARADIEAHLGMPVFLELFVKVREKWRSKKGMLKSLGY